jgi:hypothetical protein
MEAPVLVIAAVLVVVPDPLGRRQARSREIVAYLNFVTSSIRPPLLLD